jgi:dolichol-phosphate mannosyltransferase
LHYPEVKERLQRLETELAEPTQELLALLIPQLAPEDLSLEEERFELSVVIPTYKEAKNLRELYDRIFKTLRLYDFEVIFVDDNSPDGTAELAQKIGGVYGNVQVLKRNGKNGLSSAVLDGIGLARSDIVVVMDADLQHPPEALLGMVEKAFEGYDIVVGSRYIPGGSIANWSALRRCISKGGILLAHALLPETRAVKDPVSGFFMFRKQVIDRKEINASGFKILIEILMKGNHRSLAEVPFRFRSRQKGDSKFDARVIMDYIIFILKLRLGMF